MELQAVLLTRVEAAASIVFLSIRRFTHFQTFMCLLISTAIRLRFGEVCVVDDKEIKQ
jgi:hypothetical protein